MNEIETEAVKTHAQDCAHSNHFHLVISSADGNRYYLP